MVVTNSSFNTTREWQQQMQLLIHPVNDNKYSLECNGWGSTIDKSTDTSCERQQ